VQEVEVRRHFDAPRQAVWDVYTDPLSWNDWAGIGRVRLARRGEPVPNGVGCVRAMGAGPVAIHEEVLAFDPPKRMVYRVVKGGLPLRDHLGEVTFEDDGGGTLVVWRCRFRSGVPGLGPALRVLVTRVFRRALEGLARHRFPDRS
jgi:uncharacterized protein YndB with AHSA1/START domain